MTRLRAILYGLLFGFVSMEILWQVLHHYGVLTQPRVYVVDATLALFYGAVFAYMLRRFHGPQAEPEDEST